jgi:hypothetical protein
MKKETLNTLWQEYTRTEETLDEFLASYGSIYSLNEFLSSIDILKNDYFIQNISLDDYSYYLVCSRHNDKKGYTVIFEEMNIKANTAAEDIADFINRNEIKTF